MVSTWPVTCKSHITTKMSLNDASPGRWYSQRFIVVPLSLSLWSCVSSCVHKAPRYSCWDTAVNRAVRGEVRTGPVSSTVLCLAQALLLCGVPPMPLWNHLSFQLGISVSWSQPTAWWKLKHKAIKLPIMWPLYVFAVSYILWLYNWWWCWGELWDIPFRSPVINYLQLP